MANIIISNKRNPYIKVKERPTIIVYVGRPSILSNPFKIGSDGNRREVIEKYKIFLEKEILSNTKIREVILNLIEYLKNGVDVVLECWCAPLPCHGEIIKEILEKGISKWKPLK